ncbi:MAG: hypothetical protein P4L50_15945 [Anaerolineaceae bacterium]|nr:hypothetical protein [Anaerolineaceae bacterium]
MTSEESEPLAAAKRVGRRRRVEAAAAVGIEPVELEDEIRIMRSIMRRVLSLADEGLSLEEVMKVLDTIGMASTRIANLLRQQKLLGTGNGDVAAALSLALSEVTRELKSSGC